MRDRTDLARPLMDGLEGRVPAFALGTVAKLVGTLRAGSTWPVTMGLACCAIEMMAAGTARFDLSRFGMEVFRASPRQADLMLVSGRLSHKMAPVVRQVYDQMAEPKWVIAMGACACSGGIFNNYAIVQGCDHVVPVDIYLPGCPPRPEMLIYAILELHELIKQQPLGTDREKLARQVERAAWAASQPGATDRSPLPRQAVKSSGQLAGLATEGSLSA